MCLKRFIWLGLTHDLLEKRRIDYNVIKKFFASLYIEKLHFILLWVCSCIDHRRCQNVVRTSATLGCTSCFIFLGLTTFWCHLWCITEQPHSNMESMCLIKSMYEFQSRTENLNHTKTITLVSCNQYDASNKMNQWKGKAEHALTPACKLSCDWVCFWTVEVGAVPLT